MSLQVLRDIGAALHNAEFYSLMVDETTDISNKEQAVLCFLNWKLEFSPQRAMVDQARQGLCYQRET